VVDYVLVHELAHLIEAGHNDRFWSWVGRYPHADRARAWLDGYSAGARLEAADD
jgi:predicted metal-dependent hydrolase